MKLIVPIIYFLSLYSSISAQEINAKNLNDNHTVISGSDPVHLLLFHQTRLLRVPDDLGVVPRIQDYNYVEQIMRLHRSHNNCRQMANYALENCRVIKKTPFIHCLEIPLGEQILEFYDYDVAKLYSRDTVRIDTTTVWNCFGENASYYAQIEIIRDTIINKIQDLNFREPYVNQFRKTRMYALLKMLARKED